MCLNTTIKNVYPASTRAVLMLMPVGVRVLISGQDPRLFKNVLSRNLGHSFTQGNIVGIWRWSWGKEIGVNDVDLTRHTELESGDI